MPHYTDNTDLDKITKSISKKLDNDENAIVAMNLVNQLAGHLQTGNNDPVSQWLVALNENLENSGGASKVKGGGNKFDNLIEIYPSGKKGKGSEDRLILMVEANVVQVIKAAKSSH